MVTGPGFALLAVLFPVAPPLARWVTRTDERLARALLGPSRGEALALRVESLARSRAELVDAADAERRRIERDLHDGAQQRLVSLAMNLGMARQRFDAEPEPVRLAIAAAHDEAVLALTELREFIRGLHPAVLSDRGLVAALSEATSSVGYLLKDRVAHVRDFLDAVRRVADGGTALDPEVVAQLLVRRRDDPMERLTPQELQVLKLMAEGRSNTGTDHRRVLAVLKYLGT